MKVSQVEGGVEVRHAMNSKDNDFESIDQLYCDLLLFPCSCCHWPIPNNVNFLAQ
jgi:hypothetical protein